MAHFAQLDENNVVIKVIVVSNDDIKDENGNESEDKGINFCKKLLGSDTRWVQTSYNSNFRSCYAGIGYLYIPEHDFFIERKPYPSWNLDPSARAWVPPVEIPADVGTPENPKSYEWDEEFLTWTEILLPPNDPENTEL